MCDSGEVNPVCFDLEGPLAPQDNAYELMKLFPNGNRVFEVISRYDDLLTLEGRADYEPGDTLALTAPFLACHGISESQIADMGQKAKLTSGAFQLLAKLKSRGWEVFCISTSYEQYALSVTKRLGIPPKNLACTSFPLERIRQLLDRQDLLLLKQAEERFCILNDDYKIQQVLDHFYLKVLPKTNSGDIIAKVKPVGGIRKVQALEAFATKLQKPLAQWVVIGDSITDYKMLKRVNEAGGLAIAFNGNEYALPHATMSLASTTLEDLWIALEAWEKGKRRAVRLTVEKREKAGGKGDRAWFHWRPAERDLAQALEVHRRLRLLVREEAAKLG